MRPCASTSLRNAAAHLTGVRGCCRSWSAARGKPHRPPRRLHPRSRAPVLIDRTGLRSSAKSAAVDVRLPKAPATPSADRRNPRTDRTCQDIKTTGCSLTTKYVWLIFAASRHHQRAFGVTDFQFINFWPTHVMSTAGTRKAVGLRCATGPMGSQNFPRRSLRSRKTSAPETFSPSCAVGHPPLPERQRNGRSVPMVPESTRKVTIHVNHQRQQQRPGHWNGRAHRPSDPGGRN